MTTSAAFSSTSGSVHGSFLPGGEDTATTQGSFELSRPAKRCLNAPLADQSKKRRKQATPVRISAADPDPTFPEGKLPSFPSSPAAEQQLVVECKNEPTEEPETPTTVPSSRSTDLSWQIDLQNKEWLNPNMHGLPFSTTNPMYLPPLPPFSQPEPPRQPPIRIFNPDAYCDLCNKEFCNKYFLKTHKANKHGIYTDPPVSEPVSIPNFAANIKLLPPTAPSADIVTPETKPMLNAFCDIFPSPFANKLFPKVQKSKSHGNFDPENTENSAPDMNRSNGLANGQVQENTEDHYREESTSPKTEAAPQNETVTLKTELTDQDDIYNSKLSPAQQLELSNRLRRFGVMNPKAFCEICCKEYCNKYFLRTHKMKRHGIFIPDDSKDSKDIKMEANMGWYQTQTSPLNLIVAEQTNSQASYGERKTVSPVDDIRCDICGIRFQNASLALLHNTNVHAKLLPNDEQPPSSELSAEDDTRTQEDTLVNNNNDKMPNTDAISEDLQKLQTMILQLNDLDVSKIAATCSVCSKDFENRYYLHAHMMTDHGMLMDELAEADKPNNDFETNTTNSDTLCELCNKDFPTPDELKKHLSESHPAHPIHVAEIKEEYNGFTTPEKGASRSVVGPVTERRGSMSLTPTSSYCEICNKELCNKYFMKTHMQRMHGIEIENGAQIGGVICDICNKELCSKYFLRVHKHNTHGIVEYGTSLLQPRKGETDSAPPFPIEPPAQSDPALKPTDLADLSHRYFTHFTEVCSICSRRFRSTKWLKAHLLSDHGQAGADKWNELEQQLQQSIGQQNRNAATSQKSGSQSGGERASPTLKIPNGGQENVPKIGIQNVLSSIFGADDSNVKNYYCSYCPFSTPVLPFLFVHERSHSLQSGDSENNTSLKCPVCNQSFPQAELLHRHMFTHHPFLPLPPFYNGNQHTSETTKDNLDDEVEDAPKEPSPSSSTKNKKSLKRNNKMRMELPPEMGQSLKDVAQRAQVPATYALPRAEESSPYIMQAFLLDETAGERKFAPSVVFLPVLQRLVTPLTVSFTLTPA